MTAPCPFDVEVRGIGAVYVLHDLREVAGRGFEQQVIMVVHEKISVDHCIVPLGCCFKVAKKLLSIASAFEDCLAFIAPRPHMVEGSWKRYPQRSRHVALHSISFQQRSSA